MHCSPCCLFVSLVAAVSLAAQEGKPTPVSPPAAVAAPLPPPQRERPADRAALFAMFARTPGLEASYEEEKHLALLALPLRSKGRLLFLPPGYLTRLVEAPEKSELRITPAQLRIQDRDRTEVIELARSDAVRAFVTSLVQVFAGNEQVLQKSFAVDYVLAADHPRGWQLTLAPKLHPLDKMMKKLVLRGEGEAVTVIEVEDPTGDRTITRIVNADPNRKFDAAERQRWFGLEPK